MTWGAMEGPATEIRLDSSTIGTRTDKVTITRKDNETLKFGMAYLNRRFSELQVMVFLTPYLGHMKSQIAHRLFASCVNDPTMNKGLAHQE